MITLDGISLESALQRWNRQITDKIDWTHLAGQDVVRVEGGRLVQTLIRFTPPEDRRKSEQGMENAILSKFSLLDQARYAPSGGIAHRFEALHGGKHGQSDVRWYAWNARGLYGVAEDYDLTKATVDGLKAVYYQTRISRGRKKGRIIAGHRGKQTVYLWQRYLTKPATVKRLVARLKKHFGRLKAGWLVSWIELGRPQGTYAPPQWVTRHETGARGYCLNGLGDRRYPQLTLENHAKGAGTEKTNRFVRDALVVRSEAMVKRMVFLIRHPERLGEEVA